MGAFFLIQKKKKFKKRCKTAQYFTLIWLGCMFLYLKSLHLEGLQGMNRKVMWHCQSGYMILVFLSFCLSVCLFFYPAVCPKTFFLNTVAQTSSIYFTIFIWLDESSILVFNLVSQAFSTPACQCTETLLALKKTMKWFCHTLF